MTNSAESKPMGMVDRDAEWAALRRVADRRGSLAVMYGPRRVGKSYLAVAACDALGGLHHQATIGTVSMQLTRLGEDLGRALGAGAPIALTSWDAALEVVAALPHPIVVLDEFPFLVAASPGLDSVVQRHVDRGHGPALVLCGSAMATMAAMIGSDAPLYGRASRIIVPRALRGTDLAALWGTSPTASLWVDAALGGLPGYRAMVDPPTGDLDNWMITEVLATGSPLLHLGELALRDAAGAGPEALLWSVVAAIAAGERTTKGIAAKAGVTAARLARPMAALEAAGVLARRVDPRRSRRHHWTLADPALRFWGAVIAPDRNRLLAGGAASVWKSARDKWSSQVLGPRWEEVVAAHLAERHQAVGFTVLHDPAMEIDLVCTERGRITALGEAKLRRLGAADVTRLRRAAALLDVMDADVILASPAGVDPAADVDTIVDLDAVYVN